MHRTIRAIAISGISAATAISTSAEAFVAAPVGGHPGELDVGIRAAFELGKVEPNEYDGSWQKARWQVYSIGGGYTIGTVGPFDDFFIRLDNSLYRSPAESTDPDVLVNPDRGVPARCLGRFTAEGFCEFHPEDTGWLITPTVGGNLVHKADFSFGVFLQGTIPIGVNLAKFTLPRVDYFGGGLQLGVHVTPWLGYTSRIFIGSGAFGGEHTQNAAIALTNLLVFEAKRWILPWKAGVSVGPYFEGDLTERFDERYDAAYTAGYPDRRDRIRSTKFALALLPFFQITEHFAVELGYVQKFFGYDAPATQLWFAGARAAFY
jgi:hypothetical protein